MSTNDINNSSNTNGQGVSGTYGSIPTPNTMYQNSQYQNTGYANTGYAAGDYQGYGYQNTSYTGAAYNNGTTQDGGYSGAQPSKDVFKDVFVEETESVVATLDNSYVKNMVTGQGVKKDQVVLSDKRLYYNHKKGIIDTSASRECVNVDDITGTKIANTSRVGFLISAVVIFIIGLIIRSAVPKSMNGVVLALAIMIPLAYIIIFFITKNKYLFVEYAGGKIALKVKLYGMDNVIAFQKAIYKTKAKNAHK